jgi:hypothetical protein
VNVSGSVFIAACSLIAPAAIAAPARDVRADDKPAAARQPEWRFRVRYKDAVHPSAYTGRVYVFFSRYREPRHDPDWFHPEPFIARDVVDWKPGETLELDATQPDLISYPRPLTGRALRGYRAQAVVRFNTWERRVGDGPGNGYSPVVSLAAADSAEPPLLVVDHLVEAPPFPRTEWREEFTVRSELLSRFHQRDVVLRGTILLPESYSTQSDRRYPTIFTVPGFGGTHVYPRPTRPSVGDPSGVEFLRVVLDPSCPLGHHVFADSQNNGPVGQALLSEFVPAFDRAYRTIADGRARFLTGHSSGGWSTLWLQITYPELFGGTWSTSPDPVDFRDFQRIDLYRPAQNLYVDGQGRERPLARHGSQVLLTFRGFAALEDALGRGGQLHSFEAVFSPRGADGAPRPLWNTRSGAIDPDVAKAWEAYDIRLVLERRWKELAPRVAGKIHVFMGGADTFYLDGAVRLLKQSLEQLGSDAIVEIHEGRDHSTLLDPALMQRIRSEMAAAYLRSFPQPPRP